jgi:hypothetical protein
MEPMADHCSPNDPPLDPTLANNPSMVYCCHQNVASNGQTLAIAYDALAIKAGASATTTDAPRPT